METKQMTLATVGFTIKTKVTRRMQFLAEMDEVVPWCRLLAVIEPYHQVAQRGKNAAKSRDPDLKHVRKGNQWHFGMKVHAGSDRQGFVHSL